MTLFRPTAVRIALVLTLGAWLAACSGAAATRRRT